MAAVITHPTGNIVPPSFATYGTCDPGDLIRGRLVPGPIPGATTHNGNTDWMIAFINVPDGNYTLEIVANGVLGPNVNTPVMLVIPPPPSPGGSSRHMQQAIELEEPISVTEPRRVKIGPNSKKGK